MKYTNQSRKPETLAERIEDAMGFRSKVQSISLGIKLGILTAVLTAFYFFLFSTVSFDNYILVHLSKFFVIAAIMFTGFILFKPRRNQPTFAQGARLAGTITVVAAISFLALQSLFAVMGSPAYLEPELYGKALSEGVDSGTISYSMAFISFIEVVIYGLISSIACLLYFTRPLKTSKRSSNRNESEEERYEQMRRVA